MDLEDQVAIVTGGASGIGAACVDALAAHGIAHAPSRARIRSLTPFARVQGQSSPARHAVAGYSQAAHFVAVR